MPYRQKPKQNYNQRRIPLTVYLTPDKAKPYLKSAEFIGIVKCDHCKEPTAQVFHEKIATSKTQSISTFKIVCANPKCREYGNIISPG